MSAARSVAEVALSMVTGETLRDALRGQVGVTERTWDRHADGALMWVVADPETGLGPGGLGYATLCAKQAGGTVAAWEVSLVMRGSDGVETDLVLGRDLLTPAALAVLLDAASRFDTP